MNFWTLDQYASFIQHVTDIAAHAALQLLFYSGVRFGELRALTLADFDFHANTISISKTLHHTSGYDTVGPPKTVNGYRTVPMPAAIMQEVQAYTSKIYGIKPEDRVFTFTESLIRGNIRRCSIKAGIPRIRIHDDRVIIGASQKKPSKIKGLQMI